MTPCTEHLGHSTTAQRQYYEYATCDSALKAHKKLDELAKERQWPDEDIKALLRAWPLNNKMPPQPELCMSIQVQLKKSRTIQNILDKWKYLKSKQH